MKNLFFANDHDVANPTANSRFSHIVVYENNSSTPRHDVSNVALDKSTNQSSIGWRGSSSRAVDGNTNGAWKVSSTTHTNSDNEAWWKVDLGGAHQVNKVTLSNRTDCCGNRLSDFHVDLLDIDGNVIASEDHSGTAGVTTDINLSADGVYSVRVQLYGKNYLSLSEVQVFGK